MELSLVNWWEDIRRSLSTARTDEDIFISVKACCTKLGFEYCAYGIRIPSARSLPSIQIFSSYPNSWLARYQEANYVAIDPTVSIGARTRDPVIWCDRIFESAPGLWNEAKDVGLSAGLAQSSWAGHGVFTLLSFARESREVNDVEADALRPYILLLAETASATLQSARERDAMREARAKLTRREKEVLRWSGDGKTAYEVARLLNISEPTANFHVRNAARKLGVSTKIQAVAYATALGVLD